LTTVDVVVITYLRPDVLRSCLEALSVQTASPCHTIVVDSSPDRRSEDVAREYPNVDYIRNPAGAGNMTNSRNVALKRVDADVIAFLDDDAFAHKQFVEELLLAFDHSSIDLGCARTLNETPNEEFIGRDQIGVMTDDGMLLGHFGANPGTDVEIRHGIGASMCFRTSVLADLGGFREDFRGISGVREDADAFLRAHALGYRAKFVHRAVVTHVGAPQAVGRRFDWRYGMWSYRNHMVLLSNNVGVLSPTIRRYVVQSFRDAFKSRGSWYRGIAKVLIAAFGMSRGLGAGLKRNGVHARSPRRHDEEAETIRAHLSSRPT
jgi:GT2 family glycosyltransferase